MNIVRNHGLSDAIVVIARLRDVSDVNDVTTQGESDRFRLWFTDMVDMEVKKQSSYAWVRFVLEASDLGVDLLSSFALRFFILYRNAPVSKGNFTGSDCPGGFSKTTMAVLVTSVNNCE